MNEGWICPRCKKVLAPWVKECDCVEVKIDPFPYNPPQTGDPISPPLYTVCNDKEYIYI